MSEFNEVGQRALDAYEQAVGQYVAAGHKAAEAAQLDWVKTALGAHATFVRDVNAAYVKAARQILA